MWTRVRNWPFMPAVGMIVLAAVALWVMARVYDHPSTGVIVAMTLLGGALAVIGATTLNSIQDRVRARTLYGSLLRSVIRSLNGHVELQMAKIVRTGRLSPISVLTPIQIVHLSECLALAAADPVAEDLYTALMEVDKAIRHLTLLRTSTPVLQTSPWAVNAVNLAALEDGTVDHMNKDDWRYYRNGVAVAYQDDEIMVTLLKALLPEAKTRLLEHLKHLGVARPPKPPAARQVNRPALPDCLMKVVTASQQSYSPQAVQDVELAPTEAQLCAVHCESDKRTV